MKEKISFTIYVVKRYYKEFYVPELKEEITLVTLDEEKAYSYQDRPYYEEEGYYRVEEYYQKDIDIDKLRN